MLALPHLIFKCPQDMGHRAEVCDPKAGTDPGITSARQRGKQRNKLVHQLWLNMMAAEKAQEAVK